MVLQHKENFASWDNLTEVVTSGSGTHIITDSDPCNFEDVTSGNAYNLAVKTTTLPAVFVGTSILTCYVRIFMTSGAVAQQGGFFIYDGTRYVGIGQNYQSIGSQEAAIGVFGTSTYFNNAGDEIQTDIDYWTSNT